MPISDPAIAPTAPQSAVRHRLAEVKARLDAAAQKAGREPAEITLIAVSKTHGPAHILPALEAGQRAFGENRVQELLAKWPPLRQRFPAVELHLVGSLQTNKVREACAEADFLHALDRVRLADALAAEQARGGRIPKLFIQVNTGQEPQKAGVAPGEADRLIDYCRSTKQLPVIGLMCLPPQDESPAPHFALLREIARRNGLNALSMGMTADFETAISFGATHIRVGTAIFGARTP